MREEERLPMQIRGVLFDVGGPLDTEFEAERYIDEQIRARLADEGVIVTDEEYAAANDWAVSVFAPNAYTAIIWRLCMQHPAGSTEVAARLSTPRFPHRSREFRAGMGALLHRLHERELQLGLAANQPSEVVTWLDTVGVGPLFSHREVSGHHGYRKPDVRLFLRACEDLGLAPEECIMVGDRIDNDVAPAKLLGMRTVLFRTGRHIGQQPRAFDEVPDAEVRTVGELERAITGLAGPHPPARTAPR
jgi:HAD superfamily hydrolase (TIGR01509 family)